MEIDRVIPVVLRKGTFFNFILVYSMESIQNQTERNKNYISEVGILKLNILTLKWFHISPQLKQNRKTQSHYEASSAVKNLPTEKRGFSLFSLVLKVCVLTWCARYKTRYQCENGLCAGKKPWTSHPTWARTPNLFQKSHRKNKTNKDT